MTTRTKRVGKQVHAERSRSASKSRGPEIERAGSPVEAEERQLDSSTRPSRTSSSTRRTKAGVSSPSPSPDTKRRPSFPHCSPILRPPTAPNPL